MKQEASNEEKVPGIITDQEPSVQGCGSGSGSACMDPHSFSLLDPDPGGKNFQIKLEKNARKLVITESVFKFCK